MDVSNQQQEPDGEQLVDVLLSSTGLPIPAVQDELEKILGNCGLNSENLTLDELRAAMALYLESIHTQVNSEHSELSTEQET